MNPWVRLSERQSDHPLGCAPPNFRRTFPNCRRTGPNFHRAPKPKPKPKPSRAEPSRARSRGVQGEGGMGVQRGDPERYPGGTRGGGGWGGGITRADVALGDQRGCRWAGSLTAEFGSGSAASGSSGPVGLPFSLPRVGVPSASLSAFRSWAVH